MDENENENENEVEKFCVDFDEAVWYLVDLSLPYKQKTEIIKKM